MHISMVFGGRWEVTSSVNVCVCILGALALLFFLENNYSALTKSSEGLKTG